MTGVFSKYRTICGFIAGCAGGLLLFWVMYGFSILVPRNIDWCLTRPDDTAQHFIGGWAFLRDAWRWPPGLFYGLSDPDPASISVVDGIPLAALVIKLFRGARPEPFQYLGLWGLTSFMLQGGFGFLLMRRVAKRFSVQLAGTFFLLLAIPFLTRYPVHTALSSHFLLLWALYLMLGKWGRTAVAWPVLLVLALVIHPYLFAMCLAVYAGVTLQVLIREMRPQDAPVFAAEETAQGWHSTPEKYEMRLRHQAEGKCASLVAEYKGSPAGYVNVYFHSPWGAFGGKGLPEIVDFGVLQKYQRRGIGSRLMDAAEALAAAHADTVYLGVGLHNGYGSAQRMYVKRGYIPDGSGVWYNGRPCTPYDTVYTNDDDLVLYLSKQLQRKEKAP